MANPYPRMRVRPAQRRLRVAIVYSRTPVPMVRADQMTVAHLMTFLKERGHSVDLFADDTGAVRDDADNDWLANQTNQLKLYPFDRSRLFLAALTAPLRLLPFQVALFSNKKMQRDLTALADDYDIIYCYYLRSGQMVRHLTTKAKTVLAFQLSQTLNTRRISENAPNRRYAWFYRLESWLLERYEARIWRDFDRSVLIGSADVAAIEECCNNQGQPAIDNYFYGAHGTDLDRFGGNSAHEPVPGRIVFSGVMATPTNVQAAMWFADKVWPQIKAAVPNATWTIVGRNPSAEAMALDNLDGVTVTGTVPDPSVYISQAEVCVNPMQAGGGMQNKLIEFLASARATVATPVANEGIRATPGEHLIVADAPDEFARAVIELLGNAEQRNALAEAGRKFVRENWTWEAHWLKLEQDFYDVLDGKPPSREMSPSKAVPHLQQELA